MKLTFNSETYLTLEDVKRIETVLKMDESVFKSKFGLARRVASMPNEKVLEFGILKPVRESDLPEGVKAVWKRDAEFIWKILCLPSVDTAEEAYAIYSNYWEQRILTDFSK